MKRLIAIGLFVNAALLAGILLKVEVVVHAAGGGGGVPVGNGDVNADGRIDISDGVAILNWLFTGGKALVPIECPASFGKGLPDTGQSKCYGINPIKGWIEVPCAKAIPSGQDGAYSTGCSSKERFVDHGDGTVTDTCTGLMWQKETADVNGDGNSNDQDYLFWFDAFAYCENLIFAGHDDWRLPNVRELQSIVDYGRVNPSIDPVFSAIFSAFPPLAYWSSTSYANNPGYAWDVGFSAGDVYTNVKVHNYYVRAVRTEP